MAMRRLAERLTECSRKMVDRQTGSASQHVESDVLVKMGIDVLANPSCDRRWHRPGYASPMSAGASRRAGQYAVACVTTRPFVAWCGREPSSTHTTSKRRGRA